MAGGVRELEARRAVPHNEVKDRDAVRGLGEQRGGGERRADHGRRPVVLRGVKEGKVWLHPGKHCGGHSHGLSLDPDEGPRGLRGLDHVEGEALPERVQKFREQVPPVGV